MQLGPFGVIALSILIFIACTICLCLTIHVKFIWTFLCPLQNLKTCCRLFANRFRASHKATPKSILDLERRTLGSKRALKIARRVNQSCELKDFEAAGSSFEVAGSHLVELHQPPIEKPIVSAAELRQSLFLESTSRNTQTDCLLSETELLRERAGSVGQLSTREPFPRIKLVQEAGGTCQRY